MRATATDVVWPMVVALFALLSAADMTFTLTLLDRGATELNPVMAALLEAGPIWAVLFKLAVTAAVAAGLWWGRRHRLVRIAGLGFVAALSVVVAYEMVNLAAA